MGHPVRSIARGDRLVEEPETANDHGVGVGEQRVGDPAALGEVAQHLNGIVADGAQPETLRPQEVGVLGQLHELAFAIWSPVGRAHDEDYRPSWPGDRVQCLRPAELV